MNQESRIYKVIYMNQVQNTIGNTFSKCMEKLMNSIEGKWHNPDELIDERSLNENGEIILYNSRGIRRQYGRYTARQCIKRNLI
ncbi:MAG: hypothetical protein IPL53_19710 [Ignavibacteria bacterium]|nr:hypothetical protein [Ignavibacteria bacterium]